MKILDSDHCVAFLRAKLVINQNLLEEDLSTTAINVGELVHGAQKSRDSAKNLASLDVFLSNLTILPFDELAARRFGQLKSMLEKSGETLADLDLQIASIALGWEAVLITQHQTHFSRLVNHGLLLEDWLT